MNYFSLNYRSTLRAANTLRAKEWDPDNKITLAFRGCEIAGEVGEACNIIKKLARAELGIAGAGPLGVSTTHLADELADVVICADLIAMQLGIDLEIAIATKFNKTSEKFNLTTRMLVPDYE